MRKLITILLLLITSVVSATTYYVAPSTATPSGNDSNAGTLAAPWLTWKKAFQTATAGDTVYFRGGVYYVTSTSDIGAMSNSGTAENLIVYKNYPGEVPILDGSRLDVGPYTYPVNFNYRDYITIDSLTVRNFVENNGGDIICAFYTYKSDYITITNCKAYNIGGQGFGIYGSNEVRVINCDAWNLCDTLNISFGGSPGQNGVGFQWNLNADLFPGEDMYNARVYFEGCRAWNFSDNGFAAPGHGYVELKDCWAWNGGLMKGDGNGFKYGIESTNDTINPLSRVIINCIAADNGFAGFTPNNNGGTKFNGHYYNNFSYHNGYKHDLLNWSSLYGNGFAIFNYIGETAALNEMYSNNIAYDNEYEDVLVYDAYNHEYNSWDLGVTVTDDDFISLDTAELRWPRKADGSLPDINFGKLAPTSDLINAGTDVGLDYYADAPDLGWAEYSPGPQIIADHSIVDDYDNIPQYYIDSVKKMWVSYAGESHSQAIRSGLVLLENIDATYAVNVTEAGTPEAYTDAHLRASRGTWGDVSNSTGWIYDYGEEDWWTSATAIARTKAGITYANDNSLDIAAIGFGWCTDIIAWNEDATSRDPVYGCYWFGNSVGGPDGSRAWGLDADDYALTANSVSMDTYLDATQQYIDYCATNGYDTKVFFTTGPIDVQSAYEPAYQAHVKHEYIRDYVDADTTRILFDYSDILAYDDGSETPQTATWTSYTYPVITDTNQGDETIGHIGSAGALRLGKAMWWMLARIAGWDGNVTVYSEVEADSTATDILTFTLADQTGAATINATLHTVSIEVAYTADITSLSPMITLSYGATVIPASGVARDFTNPVPYTVTAEDGVTHQEWTVTVTQEAEPVTPVPTGGAIVKFNGKIVKR